jgi:DNA-directed RNA polymerase specialized sigma24 family protein
MDEVQELCERVLGSGEKADQAVAAARSATTLGGRVERLAAAARACRARAGDDDAIEPATVPNGESGLLAAVAGELQAATSRLPERQREALALRESLRLSHDQIAAVMGIDAAAAAPLLARARLALREQRRGVPNGTGSCRDRDRALRSLARRQDSEPLTGDDDAWLLAHLGTCEECDRAHAAMLEASYCYRAWSLEQRPADTNGAGSDAPIPASTLE